MSEMKCKRCGTDESRIDGFCSIECRDAFDYEEEIAELQDANTELHSRIAELEAAQRWIPVSERLPEDLQSIIVFTKDRKTYIIRFLELYGREGFGSLSDIVTHWMPLPPNPESPNDTQTQTIVYGKESEEWN